MSHVGNTLANWKRQNITTLEQAKSAGDTPKGKKFEGERTYTKQQLDAFLGKNEVYFLPYMMGERSPHNDVNARSAFLGMRPDTTRGQMTLAVLEGVTFALRDCLEAAKMNGVAPPRTMLCGGGAKSALWRRLVADILHLPVDLPQTEEGPAFGAAMLAMVGCGAYKSVAEAAAAIVRVRETVEPDPAAARLYDDRYETFRTFYPALRSAFARM